MCTRILTLLFTLILIGALPVSSQTHSVKTAASRNWKDTIARIEKVLACYHADNPGYEISISRNGALVFSKASGIANLEDRVKMTPHTISEAGSVSKQFTAAAILLLEQQGKLSLSDDVRKYIPELPDYGVTITLQHMLHHTSGLRDWGNLYTLTGWPRTTKAYNNDDALEILCHQKVLNNKPGDEFIYSNSNYNLFAIIVNRVSGMPLSEFTKKYIFEPAGMRNTSWRDDYKRVVPNRAIAYSKIGDRYESNMPNENAYGNGGMLTTSEDLLKWQQYYLSGKLGNPSILSRQITPDTLNNKLLNNYGAGLSLGKKRGWDNILHDGATAGYRAYLETFPQLKLSIAFLSNTSEFDEEAIVTDIEKIFVKDIDVKKVDSTSYAQVPTDSLQKLTGIYRNKRTGDPLLISMHGDTLVSGNDGSMKPVNGRRFKVKAGQLIFDDTGLNYITSNDTIPYSRMNPARTDTESIKAYTGEYYAEELRTTVTILIKNNVLTLQLSPQREALLAPAYEDGFIATNAWVNLTFDRDVNGRISGITASSERIRNLKFIKLKTIK